MKRKRAFSSSPSSSSTLGWKYEVFLSFRGVDTRRSFTDHLYNALQKMGIVTFRDTEDLERGKSISPELLNAIEKSRFAIIILSRSYASSSWCLDELAMIVRCKKEKGLTVLPIFYDVDPSDVRKQTGSFAQAFIEHEQCFMEKVEMWRAALREVADLAGWHRQDKHESEFIQDIVKVLFCKLGSKFSSNTKNLVGIDSSVGELIASYLCFGNRVCMIGIYGIGGLGKTTLARVIYDKLCNYFEGSCFITNVREDSEKYGLPRFQQQLLEEILEEKNIDIWDAYKGIAMIKKRLCNKKVLLVLDDINQVDQLKKLAGEHAWFGLGSWIIITTRDKHLLVQHGVDKMYNPSALNDQDALELFCSSAFKNELPGEDYMQLSCNVVYYAKGLPLALATLGSFLVGRTMDDWKSALDNLKKIPRREIFDVLKVSYDGLGEMEKEIFLDIACFFRGQTKDQVIEILENCGFDARISISVLIDKSLVSMDNQKLEMHDLLQQMGREIVCQESRKEPGKRNRLWHSKDLLNILTKDMATEAIEAIVVNTYDWVVPKAIQAMVLNSNERDVTLQEFEAFPELFTKICNLRLLIIHCVDIRNDLNHASNYLRYFPPKELVELNLGTSQLKYLWEGVKRLDKLKCIDLRNSYNLIRTPDFTGLLRLERLYLSGCSNLVDIHPSIGQLRRLVVLDLEGCQSLTNLPSMTTEIEPLKILNPCGCKSQFIGIECLTALTTLNLKACKKLRCLPSNMDSLSSLEKLSLSRCSKLANLPENFWKIKCLKELELSWMSGLEGIWLNGIGGLSSLKCLTLRGNSFVTLPASISQLSKLEALDLWGCLNLRSLPELPSTVKYIYAQHCYNLIQTPDFTGLLRLEELYLSECSKLVEIHPSIGQLRRLVVLDLEGCQSLANFPSMTTEIEPLTILNLCGCKSQFIGIECLTALTTLNLKACEKLQCLPSNMDSLSSLEKLSLSRCSKLANLPENFWKIKCLKELELSWMYGLEGFHLNGIGGLSSLKYLTLRGNSFVTLPASISQLSKLEALDLWGCGKLLSLPELPSTVKYINAQLCYSLRRSTALLILNRYLQGHLSHESSTRKKEVGSRTEFQIIIPADRIPWWLTHQRFGNSISIELPPSWCNSKWMGFALCATLDACNPPFNVDEFGVPNETFGLTACVIALGDMPHSRYASESFFRVTDDMRRHIWVLYLSCDDWFATVWKGECSQIEVEFRTSNPKLKVRQCGVSLVYEQDVEECNQTIAQRRSNLTA